MDELRTLLKRDESYAIHALINIAENPGTNAAQIAADLQIPPAFLAKVLRKLVQAKLIASRMGRNGGVDLLIDPDEISLLDVIESVSGTLILDTCQVKGRCATQQRKGHCKLKVTWITATLGIRELLANVKLSRLCDQPRAA